MNRGVTISGGLLACILSIFMHTAQVLFIPAAHAEAAGQEAWLSILVSAAVGFTAVLLGVWVCSRHPGMGPAQIARALMGKWLGGLVGLIYAAFFLWLLSLVLRDILDFALVVLLPGTPGRVVVSTLALAGLYAAWHGLEPIARVSFQVVVAITVAVFSIPFLVFREFGVLHMEPFLYHGLGPVLQSGLGYSAWFAEGIVVMTLIGHLRRPKQALPWTLVGAAGAAFILAWETAITMLVFGPDLPGRLVFPVYSLVQMVTAANILERIEVVLVIIWMSGMFIKVSLCLYAAAEATQYSLGLKTHRWAALCFAVVAVFLSQIWKGPLELVEWGASALHQVVHGSFEWGFPLLLLVFSLMRGTVKRGGSQNASL